jgi:hypothetical protein
VLSEAPAAEEAGSDAQTAGSGSQTPAPSTQDAPPGIQDSIVGAQKSKKFHKATCNSVKRIPDNARTLFATADEAREAGFEACRLCFR